jgi:hypothetical protein
MGVAHPGLRQWDADVKAVRGLPDDGLRPVTDDHGEHPAVAGQHVHRQRRHASGLGPGDQRAHQGRAHPAALPGVGDDNADVGHTGRAGILERPDLDPVRGHDVPDDDAVRDRNQRIDVGVFARQSAEQAAGGPDRGEESEEAALDG